ncbi:GATOR1 complex protein NPRL3-like [Liolophura sinensis]|uniref:GATOR1 complex protein NPRL3-like n=1 Tax=Liolophura sinensis TaxID=3198878 RepID=UPI0031595C1D
MADSDPVGVILVTAGTRGDRMLFRYPYETEENREIFSKLTGRNPYAVKIAEDLQAVNRRRKTSSIRNGVLVGFSNPILANLLALRSELCGRRFDVKIDDVRFVGFPIMLQADSDKQTKGPSILSFNIVFVLKANVSPSVVSCYQDLAKQLTVAIRHEETRCHYLTAQTKIILSIHDEVAAMPEDSCDSPFKLILEKSQLAKDLKYVYDSLCDTGVVLLHTNRWVEINFCLPHKIYGSISARGAKIEPEAVQRCLASLRPYHAMLLLVDENSLLDSLPVDCTPTLPKLVQAASPLKSLETLALDADLSLSQVFQIVSHLVYWAKATIIFPLCESNVYMLSPHAYTHVNSPQVESFVDHFPGMSLPAVLSEFSLPTPLGQHRDVLGLPQQQTQKVQMVIWMLQRRFLIQLHQYIHLVPSVEGVADSGVDDAFASGLSADKSHLGSSVEENSVLRRTTSSSDIASVNSDESPVPAMTNNLAKSPSLEFGTNGALLSDESGSDWRAREAVLCHLNKAEKDSILRVPAAKNPEDLKLFLRLRPYFNGKHHLEEIMYYENVRRSQLLTLLDKFRGVLITCSHQDPATAFYVKT